MWSSAGKAENIKPRSTPKWSINISPYHLNEMWQLGSYIPGMDRRCLCCCCCLMSGEWLLMTSSSRSEDRLSMVTGLGGRDNPLGRRSCSDLSVSCLSACMDQRCWPVSTNRSVGLSFQISAWQCRIEWEVNKYVVGYLQKLVDKLCYLSFLWHLNTHISFPFKNW